MFESMSAGPSLDDSAPSAAVLQLWLERLANPAISAPEADDGAGLIEQIALLEQVKGACAARQARLSVAFDEAQRDAQRAAGVRGNALGRGVGEQIALARRESPTNGGRHLGLGKALVHELPNTLAALGSGQISEWTATVIARETACLSAEDRTAVDRQIADQLGSLSPAKARREAWAAACRLDPAAAVNRHAKAVNDRRVSLRPAPDAMTQLSALLPVKDGVAVYAALNAAAGTARAAGDPRARGQVMADTLVERVTGRAPAVEPTVEVCLVMGHDDLLRGGSDPALLTSTDRRGSSPAADLIPAQVARDVVRDAAQVWLRRLYADPAARELVGMESTRRVFDGALRQMLILRDQTCRTPWCDAPLRHADHITPHADGGSTSLGNGQGLCERCNQTKNLPGWRAEGNGAVVRTTTPTGHAYESRPPPLLSRATPTSRSDERLAG